MTGERCEVTELLVESCACPAHRGGFLPRPDLTTTVGQPFEARYEGVCPACSDTIEPGQRIARLADDPDLYVHAHC